MPFLDVQPGLDGTLAGDVGFDPLGLSAIDFDFSKAIVPWEDSRKGVSALYYMRESELKHCRLAMLAVVGYIAVDLGVRFPGVKYAASSALSAHDDMVASGNMLVLLHFVMVLELVSGAAIFDAAKGSGRKAGYFGFDPLGFGKDAASFKRLEENEIQNGRLAMLAFGGIITQAVATGKAFPYF